MIRLLLADDEPTIRKGIRTSIDWAGYGMEVVGEAANGNDALALALETRPHVVLTDIRMPVMDGLELARRLKSELPDTRVVILSGYEDFAYAKEAVRIGAEEYLLKPVGADELVGLLSRLRDEIKRNDAANRSRQSREHAFNENRPKIRSDFLRRLLRENDPDPATVYGKAEPLHLDLSGRQYAVLAIDIDDFALMTDRLPAAERELLRYAVLNVAEEIVAARASGFVGYSEFDHLIGFVCGDDLSRGKIESLCKEIQEGVRRFLKLSVSIGIGRTREQFRDLGGAYAEAFSALKEKMYAGRESLIRYREPASSRENRTVLYPSDEEKAIANCLKSLDADGWKRAVDLVFERFRATQADAENIRSICGRLVLVSASGVEEMGIDTAQAIGADFNPYREMERVDTLAGLKEWMSGLLRRLTLLVEENKNAKFKGMIKSAIRYMEEHYDEDLSQADVAAVVFVTPNYLSRVFKEETGVNFIEWLHRYRIDKAKQLLSEPGAKTSAVAEKVGFSDYKYFSHIFKRYVGCAPKEYRETLASRR